MIIIKQREINTIDSWWYVEIKMCGSLCFLHYLAAHLPTHLKTSIQQLNYQNSVHAEIIKNQNR